MSKAEVVRRKAQGSPRASREAEPFRHTPYSLLLCCALAAPPALGASAQLDVSNVGRGTPAQYVKVVGARFAGEARGDNLHIRVQEVRLESTGKLPAVRYTGLGVAVQQGGKVLRVNWEFDVGGELTSAKPSVTLSAQEFVLPGAAQLCLQAPCEVRLQLRVETAPDKIHAEHTDFAALPVTKVAALVQPAPRARAKPPAGAKAVPAPAPPARQVTPPAVSKPVPRGPAPEARQTVDKEIDLALAAFAKERRAEAEMLLEKALAISIKGKVIDARHPLAAQLLYQANDHYERLKAPRQQELALLWSLAILEKYPNAEVQKAIGAAGAQNTYLDKEIVARQLGNFYWQARRNDRSFEYYDRAYRYVADILLPEPIRNLRLALNAAGRMATACGLGKWDIADAAMKELKERAPRVDAGMRQQLDNWIRYGGPRLAARKC